MLLRNNDKFQHTGDADSFLEMKQTKGESEHRSTDLTEELCF